jgi:hypothetical protein
MSENGGRRASRNPEERIDRASVGNYTGYGTQDEGHNVFTDIEHGSANATMENTMGFRSTGRIPLKGSMVKRSGARTKSMTNMHKRYANDSKLKLDHTSFI